MKNLELYFHIPFCVRKCLYCDFLSAPADEKTKDAYMEALLKEMRGRAEEYQEYLVDTIFIGGGTPSVVNALWIERLLEAVHQCFSVSKEAEISIEVNPGTVDGKKLSRYFAAGVNRLSIGLQSADEGELLRLGRVYTWQDFQEVYQLAVETGFRNLNVDIMSALPWQSLDSYCSTLEKVLKLNPQPAHISAYSLIVEEGTFYADLDKKGLLKLPDEECERRMYEETQSRLKRHGYERYEISNYAKEGFACRHNCGYWRRTDYVGFGIGAASLVENKRFQNGRVLADYVADPMGCRGQIQELSVEEQMEEFLFLGLRMTAGVEERAFRDTFGKTLEEVYGAVIEKNISDGLLEYREGEASPDRRLVLTERGLDISNYVMAQFLFD